MFIVSARSPEFNLRGNNGTFSKNCNFLFISKETAEVSELLIPIGSTDKLSRQHRKTLRVLWDEFKNQLLTWGMTSEAEKIIACHITSIRANMDGNRD